MDLEDDIPENHPVLVVNNMVYRLNDSIFDAAYPGGGRDSYRPKMLTKIISIRACHLSNKLPGS